MFFDIGKAIMDTINTVANTINEANQANQRNQDGKKPMNDAPHADADSKQETHRRTSSNFNTQNRYTPSLDFGRVWRFNRSLLSPQDQGLYDAINEATARCVPSVRFRCSGAPDPNYLMQVTLALIEDDPSLFYVDSAITVKTMGDMVELQFKYNRYLKDKDGYYQRMKDVAKKVYETRVRNCTTVYDAELAIHDYLVQTVTYDKTDDVGAHSPVGPLLDGRGVCEGISEAFCFIASACGIKTSMMSGMLGNERHRWNILEIDGQRYHLDVTSDLGGLHAFFNCNDEKIRQTHSFEKKSDCRSMDYNYYKMNNALFNNVNDAQEYLMRNARNVPSSFELMLERKADPNQIGKAVQMGLRRSASINIMSSNNGCYRISLASR